MEVRFFANKNSANLFFSGRQDVRRKSDEFTDRFVKYARHSDLNLKELKNFIKGYSSDLKVRQKAIKSNPENDIAGE